jgi:hypothetical protein
MNDSVGGGGCVGEEMRTGRTRGGWRSLVGATAVKLNGKKNRETGRQMVLDGSQLVGGHNNQITVDERGLRGDEGERRSGWSLWDGAVASIRPSNRLIKIREKDAS